ncbi:MAG: YjbQ family protein, partial [Terriglobia bacterium]
MSQKGVETVAPGPGSLNHVNGLRLRAESLTVTTCGRVELVNITETLAARVRASGVRDGLVLVNSLHTTLALFINEFQAALLEDIRSFLERVVVQGDYYKHNDPEFSDCDRFNA